jgi:uncharacterized membrane protein YkvA (DUF1232 family)
VDARLLVGIVVGLLAVWGSLLVLLWLMRPKDARLRDLLAVIPDLLRLVRDLLGDREVPLSVRITLLGLFAYLVNPIDLVPEFVPVLGPLDDVVVAVLVLRHVARRLGREELRRRWQGTESGFALLSQVLGST